MSIGVMKSWIRKGMTDVLLLIEGHNRIAMDRHFVDVKLSSLGRNE